MSALTNTTDLYRRVSTPIGYEPLEAELDPLDLEVTRLRSGATCVKGDLLFRSAGRYTPVTAAIKPGQDPVIAQESLTATSTDYELTVWTGFRKGKRAKVVSTGAVNSAAGFAISSGAAATVIVSGAAVDSALFVVSEVLNLTNKVIVVTLNRGQNS